MKNRIEDTNFYKFLKEEIEMIVECSGEDKYNKLTEADKDTIIKRLINDEDFTQTISDTVVNFMNTEIYYKYEKNIEEEEEEIYFNALQKNVPSDIEKLDSWHYKYKNKFVELRPDTITNVNGVYEMNFAIFDNEEDMNEDYNQNVADDYWNMQEAEKYWDRVKAIVETIL